MKPEQSRWLIGGIDFPLKPIDWLPQPHPTGMEVVQADAHVDLGEFLIAGEIDALISADAPKVYLENSPAVGRLFENYVEVDRDYFRRTGNFPIMHLCVVREELAHEHPEIVKAVYKGFKDAKTVAKTSSSRA